MKNFLKLVETARTGIIGLSKGSKSEGRLYKAPDDFWDLVEQCQSFVFSPKNEIPTDLGIDAVVTVGSQEISDLDAPFKVFSVEILGGPVCSPKPEDEMKFWVDCIMVVEVAPKKFLYYDLLRDADGRVCVFASNVDGEIIKELLGRLSREEVGHESVRAAVKIGTGKEKRTHRIRKVIHVCPKKVTADHAHEVRAPIDWSHRWKVMGHWRTVSGLGKDREGKYCVEGYTWVVDHVKGPESAPIIDKVRTILKD